MNKLQGIFAAATLVASGFAFADTANFASGNMHFDVNEMDANHDGMVTFEEYAAYGEVMWKRMAQGKDTLPVKTAAGDFANGNMKMSAKDMDTDHDGSISKDEFMSYAKAQWDKQHKDDKGMIAVADAAKDFSRGNMHKSP
jgi:EF hand